MDLDRLILSLYEIGSISFGDFILASGIRSPYYIDLRRVMSYPDLFRSVIELYKSKLLDIGYYDALSGIETGSIPIASILSYILNKPLLYVRKKPKKYGLNRFLEGVLNSGMRIVVIEDVVTTGRSIMHAVETIRSSGGIVDYAIAFIDREQGASHLLHRNRVKLIPILRVREMFKSLHRNGVIPDEVYAKTMDYIGGGDVEG